MDHYIKPSIEAISIEVEGRLCASENISMSNDGIDAIDE